MKKYFSLAIIMLVFGVGACMSPAARYTKKGDKRRQKGEYEFAAENYKQALTKKGANASYLNAQVAESYRLSNRLKEATPYYKAALDAGNKADSVRYNYAAGLKSIGQYRAAADAFNDYVANGGRPVYVERAQKELNNIKIIDSIAALPPKYAISNFEPLNTAATEYSPFYNNNELFFTSSRGATKIYAQTGTGFTDLYKYKFDGADLKTGVILPLDAQINTNIHEASVAITKDGKLMVFARSNDGKAKGAKEVNLYMARYKNGIWDQPERMTINDANSWNGSPAFSPDGKTLYFASNRPGGQGGLDLYRANRDANGRWSKVSNMGDKINTFGDEVFPFVSDDGKLYFASDGHPGLGGLDLFMATKQKDKPLSIDNMGPPVNSAADDFGISFKNAVEGYFASNREGGKGEDDIYSFQDAKAELKIVKYVLNGTVVEKDETGNEVVLANTNIKLLSQNGQPIANTTTGPDGKFSFNLDASQNYVIVGEKPEYFTKRDLYTTYGKQPDQSELKQKETVVKLDYKLPLEKLKVDKVVVIENIYYDLNSAEIRSDASEELDKVVEFLQDNPNISVEMSSHTDDRGDADYNIRLSQRRADSAVQYLISKGITAGRLTAKGYGEGSPLIENATTEEDYQKNRRTEFKVVKIR